MFDRVITEGIAITTVMILLFFISSAADSARLTLKGTDSIKYRSFDELLRINPDTCAWLRVDGTHINHPVVQGENDYKYLETDFYGKYYAGGTLFLSHKNKRDFSDSYNVIHGHHMAMGAMFGDLGKYRSRKYFDEHKTGVLLTPAKNYRLKAAAVCRVNAHDAGIYNIKLEMKKHIECIREAAVHIESYEYEGLKLLALSTCTGDMDDYRTVVVFIMEQDEKLKSDEEGKIDA